MAIRVALEHRTRYLFDRPVNLSPHEIRLRPAPHCRTPLLGYSLTITPEKHFLNWQQDPYGNFIARAVFPEKARELEIVIDLVADMTVINPFDFFVESYAEHYPFLYPAGLKKELAPFLEKQAATPLFAACLTRMRGLARRGMAIANMLVAINQQLSREIRYLVRMEPGVQAPEETLTLGSGSCRDTGWLLVQLLRHLGIAARFASGYLIQLTADIKALDGPSGPEADFTDLHAWCEAYIPGAGWIGLDPTSGLLAGEGHIPLACTASPQSAAPVIGLVDPCTVDFAVTMKLTRVHEDPRVTKPLTDTQWDGLSALGHQIDAELRDNDVRLTQGGEPTFVSVDDMEGAEWNFAALSPRKLELGRDLARRLARRFAANPAGGGYLLHEGQGKWYPGEPLPRWALTILWRADGEPLWNSPDLLADTGRPGQSDLADAERLLRALLPQLGLDAAFVRTAYEDVPRLLIEESRLPPNIDPLKSRKLKDAGERSRLAQVLQEGNGAVAGFVLPLRARPAPDAEPRRGKRAKMAPTVWQTSPWPLRRERLYLLAGDSPLGLRLPLDSLPWVLPEDHEPDVPPDPFASRAELSAALQRLKQAHAEGHFDAATDHVEPREVIKTALCLQVRDGHIHVFLPPLPRLEDSVALLGALEAAARAAELPIMLEGYPPPRDPRLVQLAVTPDPGVIEVNVQPARTWDELVTNTQAFYDEARLARLGTDKFMLDGRHTGTGGGNHVTLGGATPADSPLLRRPDLLRSLITYWQIHPALSYLFSGTFIGPTSQAPRVDEARDDRLYELAIAFQQLSASVEVGKEHSQPWLIDRLLRHLLTDLTGNTHRSEFCIDKLFSPDTAAGRLGLLEFRGFEMPPHWQMSLLQMLLLRALVARFWCKPFDADLVPWDTSLHDQFMLPHFVCHDLADVLADLRRAGYAFEDAWFAAFIEFRFPRFGTVSYDGVTIELRQAIEPWHVLGEEMAGSGTSRYVDSSVERLQVKVTSAVSSRHVVTCNGRPLPLNPTGIPGEFVAGVRFRAWNPPSALHPTIGVQAPLVFDLIDTWSNRSLGGCTYHVSHPGGRSYDTFPVNANEAEARRVARFWPNGHTPGPVTIPHEPRNPAYPMTLDLRWKTAPSARPAAK